VIFNGRWELLLQFPFILMLSVQLFFLILLFVPGMVQGWYLALWIALAVTPAIGGHVWGMEHSVIALTFRMVHQLTIAFWLGALSYVILLLIWQKKQNRLISWTEFRPFFVRKMLIASGLVLVSGVIMVFLQTGITAVFSDWMTWSTVVIFKVGLTIAMLCLAIYQTMKWKKTEMFATRRWIRSEWIIGLVVIVLGVWASQIAYPIAVQSYDKTLVADQIKAQVHIVNLETGYQKMTAKISELDGKQPEEVSVKITMLQHDMGSTTLTAKLNDRGEYIVDLPFTMAGSWLLEVSGKYPDGEKKKWEDEIFIVTGRN
jgi:copper transport protein